MESLGFGILAGCALMSAFAVVRSANLVHAVLWLGVTLVATAGLYAMLGASFLASVQVLLYVGGVVTLMIFGLMMTRRHGDSGPQIEDVRSAPAALAAIILFGATAWAVVSTDGLDAPVTPPPAVGPAALGRALVRDHVLAFETISMLLLVAIVGAIVIARRKDPGGAAAAAPASAASVAVPKAAE